MADPTYHLSVFAFDHRPPALLALENAQEAAAVGMFRLADWAVITKEVGGATQITSSRETNPGALRGGVFGGGAGLVLAVLSGPIGAGAVLGGAAIGAVTAGLVDSGFPAARLKEISTLMRDGRSLLLLAVPNEDQIKLEGLVAAEYGFASAAGRYDADIAPGNTLADAIEQYRLDEED